MSGEINVEIDRKLITARRAMDEFLLSTSDLSDLQTTFRRSPFDNESKILVYNRSDVVSRALEVWGNFENLKIKRQRMKNMSEKDIPDKYEIRKSLRQNESLSRIREQGRCKLNRQDYVVFLAVAVDILNIIFKIVAWRKTESKSILSEAIHSAADVFNQIILLYGVLKSHKRANKTHPYGFYNSSYVVALISGVGIFCLGAAVSIFMGIRSLVFADNSEPDFFHKDLMWVIWTLLFGFVSESVSLICSIVATVKGARANDVTVPQFAIFMYEYFMLPVFRAHEPGISVVILEDLVGVIGIVVAAAMLALGYVTSSTVFDAVGSIIVGCLLALVSAILVFTSSTALVGRSVPLESLEKMNRILESDVMIRAIYDVKGVEIGNNMVRYKAEIDFDGVKLTHLYLDQVDTQAVLLEMQNVKTTDHVDAFMVKHGERIVDLLGSEIDRIERRMRKHFPNIRHVDLEIL